METRGKTNNEFRGEVTEILNHQESNVDQLTANVNQLTTNMNQMNATLQIVMIELQTLRLSRSASDPESHPLTTDESSHRPHETNNPCPHIAADRNHHHLKLSFPKFGGKDATGWIYKAEQYFEFKDIAATQRVQLASFHLEEHALQWHRWYSKYKGSATWEEFTKAILIRFGPTDYEDPSE